MQQAREEAKQAVDLDPRNLLIRINYALYAMYAGEFDLAAAEAKTVLDQQRTYHLPYLPLAIAALAKNDIAGARAVYGDMAKSGARGASLAPLGLADVALYEGRAKEAVTLLEEAIAADEKAANTAGVASKSVLLAEAYERLGQTADAVAAANAAIKSSNGRVEARVPAASVVAPTRTGQGRADDCRRAVATAAGTGSCLRQDPRRPHRRQTAAVRRCGRSL